MKARLECARLRLDIYRMILWVGLLYLANFGQYNDVEYLTPAAVVGMAGLLIDLYFDMRQRSTDDGRTQ